MPCFGDLCPPGPIWFDNMNFNEMMVEIDVTQDGVGEETHVAGPGTDPESSRGAILEAVM